MRWIWFFLLLSCAQADAQLLLRVNDAKPVTISASDLAKLPRHAATINDHGKQISFQGVLLQDVLALGGVDLSKELRGKQLSSYLAVLAADGYEVVYALAEVDSTVMDSGIIVADRREGQPLAGSEGPLRLIAPHDKRPTRCVRMLQEIDVVQLKK